MTYLQKLVLFIGAMYLLAKISIFFVLYLATVKVEKKALAYKKKREMILRRRWLMNRELYTRQYNKYERKKERVSRLRDYRP